MIVKFLLPAVAAALLALPAAAQDKTATSNDDNMQILRDKLKADKKLLIAANLDLTQAEAKGFWPIYEDYQKELNKLNDRIAMTLVDYAKQYNAGKLSDAKARDLLDQYFAIEDAELKVRRAIVPRLAKVLPGVKVARYVQLENKIRALVKYEIAGEVPLAK
jgi:hypothetical protein